MWGRLVTPGHAHAVRGLANVPGDHLMGFLAKVGNAYSGLSLAEKVGVILLALTPVVVLVAFLLSGAPPPATEAEAREKLAVVKGSGVDCQRGVTRFTPTFAPQVDAAP